MIDIGWSEMAVVALIALLILGPKELPQAMRMVAHWVKKARSVTREVQSGINDMIREAELEDAKKVVESARPGALEKTIGSALDPTGGVGESLSDVERETRKAESEAKSAAKGDTASGSDVPASSSSEPKADAQEGATLIKQPTTIAPPHSLGPPPPRAPESASQPEPEPASEAGGDETQKRA